MRINALTWEAPLGANGLVQLDKFIDIVYLSLIEYHAFEGEQDVETGSEEYWERFILDVTSYMTQRGDVKVSRLTLVDGIIHTKLGLDRRDIALAMAGVPEDDNGLVECSVASRVMAGELVKSP